LFYDSPTSPDPALNQPVENLSSESGTSDGTSRPVPEPEALTKIDSAATKTPATPGFGLSGGQMFMMFLTLIGVVLVAQGLRKKNAKSMPSELAEIDSIRRELAAKYPVDPPKPRVTPQTQSRELAADMKELTDRLSSQLEAKAARIEALLVQADARIIELKYLASTATHGADAPVARIGATEPRSLRIENPVDPIHQKVYDLADAGMNSIDIARVIGQPTGHIELILNLRSTAQSVTR
jgi:hypothetical protein